MTFHFKLKRVDNYRDKVYHPHRIEVLMLVLNEQLKALEERIDLLMEEYLLAKERHEFLQQYDLHQEMKKLKQQYSDIRKKMKM